MIENRLGRLACAVIALILAAFPIVITPAELGEKPQIDVREMQEWGNALSDPSMCPRAPGTIKLDRCADWIEDKLKSFGLETWREAINFTGVFHKRWELKVLSPIQKELVCYPQKHTGFGDFEELHLVDVGYGYPWDYLGKDVKGRAVLINLQSHDIESLMGQFGRPINKFTHGLIPAEHGMVMHYNWAAEHGASAMVGYFDSMPEDMIVYALLGLLSNAAEIPMPQLTIGLNDASYLKEACAKGPVKIRFLSEGDSHVSTAPMIVGRLPGKTDDIILFTKWYDAPFSGANPNQGIVCTLEVAKYFSKLPLEEREKTLMFMFDPTLLYINCNLATLTFAENHPDLLDKIVCQFHMDGDWPYFTDPTTLIPYSGIMREKLKDLGIDWSYSPLRWATVAENPFIWYTVLKNLWGYVIKSLLEQGIQGSWPYQPGLFLVWPNVFLVWCSGCLRYQYGVPVANIMSYTSWRTGTTEDTWGYITDELLYGLARSHIEMVEDLDSTPGDILRKADLGGYPLLDKLLQPKFGCGTYFGGIEPIGIEYPPGESYVPEPGEPLLVGGYYKPVHWETSPFDSFTPTSAPVVPYS